MTDQAGSDASVHDLLEVCQPKLIAFYLPQFHPIPENDLWWGKGFTEWTNVTKAKPLFDGHYQPHLPSELGFYDLRLREVRHEQITLAKQYGIDGFCYHYYWFAGKRLLHRPVVDMLQDPASDMPFCLCWANENWTRRWDASENEILIAQTYRPEDHLNFIKSLVPFFEDKRYIRVGGAPILVVYRPQHMPDPRAAVEIWRDYCLKNGIGKIHLCAALTHGNMDYAQFDFDSGVEFPPHNLGGIDVVNDRVSFHEAFHGYLFEYDDVAGLCLERKYENHNVFRTVFPSWDNTARTGSRSLNILNATPQKYERWLSEAIRRTAVDFHKILALHVQAGRHSQANPENAENFPIQDRLVFINAWNEWAEGCHLEPDRKYGRQFLEANLRAKTLTANGLHCEALTPHQDQGLSLEKLSSLDCSSFCEGPHRKGRFWRWAEKLSGSLPLFSSSRKMRNGLRDKYIRDCYLSLIQNCLTGTIYEDPPMPRFQLAKFNLQMREAGLDWPLKASTMVGVKRLANLRALVEKIIEDKVPGDLIETGVWRGGACILMRAVLNAYSVTDRRVWVADSFQGLPPPDPEYPADKDSLFHTYPELTSSLPEVMGNFAKYGLLDAQVAFLPGWFHETLPGAPVKSLALLRLDADMYKFTIVALNSLYDKLSVGGYVIVDDYHIVPQAKKAVHDFAAARQISPQFTEIDGVGVYWRKK